MVMYATAERAYSTKYLITLSAFLLGSIGTHNMYRSLPIHMLNL